MKATIMVLNATLKISGTLHAQNYNRTPPLHEILHLPLDKYEIYTLQLLVTIVSMGFKRKGVKSLTSL